MANRGEIRDYARTQTMLDVGDIGDDKLNAIINAGVHEVARRFKWPFLAAEQAIVFNAEDRSQPLPEDCTHIEAVVRLQGKRLNEVAATTAWQLYGDNFPSGPQPTEFFIWNGSLYLIPYPTELSTYMVYYLRQPATLDNDEDSPEWDARFHMVLADYLIARMWEREEEDEKAMKSDAAFALGVEQMARHYINLATDSPVIFGENVRINQSRSIRSFIPGIDG